MFAIPFALVAAPAEWVLWRTGECWPVAWVAHRQAHDPEAIYGRGLFSQQYDALKVHRLRIDAPEILVLGDSRVMQFRRYLFPPFEDRFYNAGGAVACLDDLFAYLDAVDAGTLPRPRVLVCGLSPWWFAEGHGHDGRYLQTPHQFHDAAVQLGAHRDAIRILWSRWRRSQPAVPERDPLLDGTVIGFGARTGHAFRADGSRLYLAHVREFLAKGVYRDRETPPVIETVRERNRHFRPGQVFDDREARRLVDALAGMDAHGVEVHVLLPPFSNEVAEAIAAHPDLVAFQTTYRHDLTEALEAVGVAVTSVDRPAAVGLDDRAMFDGMHPGEVLCSRIVERMAAHAPAGSLLGRIDLPRLDALRQTAAAPPLAIRVP
ncbi:MAG: hypothetical protein ACOCX4_09910 [Planctomycetota bacterium]